MILTCPECATRYFVDDAKLGSTGRTVRCAHCGARWAAAAETPLELSASPEEGALAAPEPEPAEAEAEMADLTAQDLPKAFRAKAETQRKEREAVAAGVIWGAMAAGLAILIGALALFRTEVVKLWPRSASAYAAVGLPVNPVGFVFEDVKAQPALQEGHAALVVSGAIRNVEGRPMAPPPLRIDVLDKDGKTAASKIADPRNAKVPAGENRRFSVSLIDPPVSADGVQITFVLEPSKAGAPSPAPAAAAHVSLRPAAPVESTASVDPAADQAAAAVKPLPSGSPYALPQGGAQTPVETHVETRPHG